MRKLCEKCKSLSWARPHLRTRLSRTAPLEASRAGGFDRLVQERVIPNECPNKNQTFMQPPASAQRSIVTCRKDHERGAEVTLRKIDSSRAPTAATLRRTRAL